MTSSSKAVSSSSVILSGSEGSSDSSSSSKKVSSSSEYVPFNHYKCLADNRNYEKSDYKTFVDPRNGRSYYYYTATSDFIVVAGFNDDRMGESIAGLRSQCFSGYNTSGFSLIGGGLRTAEGKFADLNNYATWFRPEEYEQDATIRAHHAIVASQLNSGPQKEHRELKIKGFSVRCTKLE